MNGRTPTGIFSKSLLRLRSFVAAAFRSLTDHPLRGVLAPSPLNFNSDFISASKTLSFSIFSATVSSIVLSPRFVVVINIMRVSLHYWENVSSLQTIIFNLFLGKKGGGRSPPTGLVHKLVEVLPHLLTDRKFCRRFFQLVNGAGARII